MFYQAGILEHDDLFDMGDFTLFQETVSRTMQIETISANHVCNFIQQVLYYNQCTTDRSLDFTDYKAQLDVFLRILLQTTMKKWSQPGKCKCDYIEKLNCKYCHKYSILHQHFPDTGEGYIENLMDTLVSSTLSRYRRRLHCRSDGYLSLHHQSHF